MDAEYFDGYDNQGNLFADGLTSSGYFALVELPKGSRTFETITTSNSVQFPGSVQWDGTYLTVFDQEANATYQYTVSGTTATLKGTVTFTGPSDCAQTWIVKGLLYCGDAGNGDGEVFKYPAGGSAIAVLGKRFARAARRDGSREIIIVSRLRSGVTNEVHRYIDSMPVLLVALGIWRGAAAKAVGKC